MERLTPHCPPMSPQCSTKRSAALGSFPAFSVISVITEMSEIEERKSSAQAIRENLSELQRVTLWLPDQLPQEMGTDRSRACRARPRPKPRAFGQRFMQHQHLADGLGGDETHEPPAAVDHGDGGRRFFLQHAERLFQAAAMTDGRHRGGHGVGDAGVGAELLERANEIAAAEEADRLSCR